MDEMVNKTYTFKILKYNKKRNNIVLSRRVLLEAERDILRSSTLKSIEDGKVMEGIVKNILQNSFLLVIKLMLKFSFSILKKKESLLA